jgi:hypothetical protein
MAMSFVISEELSGAVLFHINFAAYVLVLRVIIFAKFKIGNKLNYARLPQGIIPQRPPTAQRFLI